MNKPQFSRRDFLKLASLGAAGLATPRWLRRPAAELFCPPPPEAANRLTAGQRTRLAQAARAFVAPDLDAARQMAIAVDFIAGPYEDASTMCGPLAIAILQNAGLLGLWAKRHDFWLLNPKVSLQPVENTFPDELYEWQQSSLPLSLFDFTAAPLLAGDLVYLHAKPGDTFEHMFVVTRVDAVGRAYTTSNFFIASGTIIEERMLYDPAQPGIGQLANWADRNQRNLMGNTGGGGYRIWRVKDGRSLVFPTDFASQKLRADLDILLLSAPGEWYSNIKKVGGPLLYQFNPYAAFNPGSTINLPVALGFYHWLESQSITDWPSFLRETSAGGRSVSQLLRSMLVKSEQEATEVLVDFLGKIWLDELWRSWDLDSTRIDPRRTSATELSTMFESLYAGKWVSAPARADLLGYLSAYAASDQTHLGLLRPRLPASTIIYNQRGALAEWPRVVADSGIVELPDGNAYIFTLHGLGKNEASIENLEATLNGAIDIFGGFLSA